MMRAPRSSRTCQDPGKVVRVSLALTISWRRPRPKPPRPSCRAVCAAQSPKGSRSRPNHRGTRSCSAWRGKRLRSCLKGPDHTNTPSRPAYWGIVGDNETVKSENPRNIGIPKGSRTPVFAVRGRCPGPLDDGDVGPRRTHIATAPLRSTAAPGCRVIRLQILYRLSDIIGAQAGFRMSQSVSCHG